MKALVVSIGLLLGGVLNAWGQDDSWQDVIAELATSDDMESPAWDNYRTCRQPYRHQQCHKRRPGATAFPV